MNILPKKQDVLREKTLERKKEIDAGIALANRIDKLREVRASEEQHLKEWRENSIRAIQREIDDYLTVKENLRVQTEEAEVHRKKLLEPLDKEWMEVNTEKARLEKEKQIVSSAKEHLKQETDKIKVELEKISNIITKVKSKENEAEKTKQHTNSLNQLAQREFELARTERETHAQTYEKALSEMRSEKESYESSIKIIEIREKEVNEKEAELIIREQHLESQQRLLKKANEIIKKQ